jgi:hypothetical protein
MAWHNGPVESYHAIVKETIAAQYPFSTLAQERLDKTPYWPDPSLIPSFEDWAADFIGAVRKYNKTHQPRKLGGKTPLQAWVEAKEKPEPLEERFARLLAVRRRRVTVYRGAITLDSDCYVSSRLGSLSRTDVEVGTPEDHRIDVFDLQGRHICRAVDQRFADADEWSAIGHEREERRRADHQVAEDTLAEMEEALRRRAAATSDARAAETVGDRSGDEEEHA